MKTKAITINEHKLRKARLLCGVWPFFYGVATPFTYMVVSSTITLFDMAQRRLLAVLYILTMGLSMVMVYAIFQFLLEPMKELFRMSRPNGHLSGAEREGYGKVPRSVRSGETSLLRQNRELPEYSRPRL